MKYTAIISVRLSPGSGRPECRNHSRCTEIPGRKAAFFRPGRSPARCRRCCSSGRPPRPRRDNAHGTGPPGRPAQAGLPAPALQPGMPRSSPRRRCNRIRRRKARPGLTGGGPRDGSGSRPVHRSRDRAGPNSRCRDWARPARGCMEEEAPGAGFPPGVLAGMPGG